MLLWISHNLFFLIPTGEMGKARYILLALLFFLSSGVLCQEMPKDVPEDHFAYQYIQDLVDRGIDVTAGNPDGTFYGSKLTTKYDITYFCAALAIAMNKDRPADQFDKTDIEDEIDWLRNEIQTIKNTTQEVSDFVFSGQVDLNSKFGNLVGYVPNKRGPIGPENNYRFRYSIAKWLGSDASMKLNIDTMDGGFNSQTKREFPMNLLDFEGKFNADVGLNKTFRVKVLSGPGTIVHRDTTGVVPSDDHTVYARPKNSLFVNTDMWEYDVGIAYVSRGVSMDGAVSTHEVNLNVSRILDDLPYLGTTEVYYVNRYICSDFMNPTSLPDDFRQEIKLISVPVKGVKQQFMLGASSVHVSASQYFMNYELELSDVNGSGSTLAFRFNSAGNDYRMPFEKLEFTPLNIFDKRIFDGTNDIALEISKPLFDGVTLISKTDSVFNSLGNNDKTTPGTSFTQEMGIRHQIRDDLAIETYYRYFFIPSKVDMYGTILPEYSDLIGINVNYRF
jgi:hypothetical protein